MTDKAPSIPRGKPQQRDSYRGELYSRHLRNSKGSDYFMNLKENREGDIYLNLVESCKSQSPQGKQATKQTAQPMECSTEPQKMEKGGKIFPRRHSILVFAEQRRDFAAACLAALAALNKGEMGHCTQVDDIRRRFSFQVQQRKGSAVLSIREEGLHYGKVLRQQLQVTQDCAEDFSQLLIRVIEKWLNCEQKPPGLSSVSNQTPRSAAPSPENGLVRQRQVRRQVVRAVRRPTLNEDKL